MESQKSQLLSKPISFNLVKRFSHLQVIGELEWVAPLGIPAMLLLKFILFPDNKTLLFPSHSTHKGISATSTRIYPRPGSPLSFFPFILLFNSWDTTSLDLLPLS
ncbi:unnamed protein product [Meloidogyne enterolobii]|uniref:Uncharacterized protein n=1 Tax=Meloidogyne enterolobii TaxID=390850 RepID=A0ACB1AZ59_MELEN